MENFVHQNFIHTYQKSEAVFSHGTPGKVKQVVTYAWALMEDSKILFEAVTMKTGPPAPYRILKDKHKLAERGKGHST